MNINYVCLLINYWFENPATKTSLHRAGNLIECKRLQRRQMAVSK